MATGEHQFRTFRSRSPQASDRTVLFGASLKDLQDDSASDKKIIVEIGCGVGLHPIQYALSHPASHKIVAIERTSEKFDKFRRRLEAHPELMGQICAVHSDAIHFLDRYFTTGSIDEVWLLYPNPETKKPSKRWFRAPFMIRLVDLLKPEATLRFATNLADYAEEVPAFAKSVGLALKTFEAFDKKSRPGFRPRTHFEKKYYERGEKIYDFDFRKSKETP